MYGYTGKRYQDKAETPGSTLNHVSSVWDDGTETDRKLRGVCAIDSEYTGKQYHYSGDYEIVLGSDDADFGEDPGEIIMVQPVVISCKRR